MNRTTELAQSMGLRNPEAAGPSSGQSTAVARVSTAGRWLALLVDVVDLAARIYPWYHKDPAEARRRIRKRLVMNPNEPTQPHVSDVMIEARDSRSRHWMIRSIETGPKDNRRTKLVPAKWPYKELVGTTQVPDTKRRGEYVQGEVLPLFTMDGMGGMLQYMHVTEHGTLESTGTMPSVLLRPEKRRGQKEATGPLRFIPLGLCLEYLVENYNDLADRAAAQGASQGFVRIQRIPNALRRQTPFLFLAPLGAPWMGMYKNRDKLQRALKKVNKGSGQIPRPDYEVAHFAYGKVIRRHRRSQNPAIYQLNATTQGCIECVWRVVETERAVEIIYLGERGKLTDIGARVRHVESIQIDGFAVLGLRPQDTAPGRMIVDKIRRLMSAPRDATNPLYVQAIEVGMITPDDDETVKGNCMEMLALQARTMIETELNSLADQWIAHLTMPGFQDRPSIDDILSEKTGDALKAAVGKKKGDDCPLATWIGTHMAEEGAFNWGWLMRKVRREVLLSLARTEGIHMPKRGGGSKGGNGKSAKPPETKVTKRPRKRKPRGKKAPTEGEQAQPSA